MWGDERILHAKWLQSCPTLCNPRDCSPPDTSVHGILQSRILEWVARPSSRGSSQPRDRTQVSIKHAKEEACLCVPCTAGRLLPFAPSGKYNSNLQIHYNPYQNHNGRFCKNVKAYPKIHRNCKELWLIKIILKQMSKFGGFTFSDFKAY